MLQPLDDRTRVPVGDQRRVRVLGHRAPGSRPYDAVLEQALRLLERLDRPLGLGPEDPVDLLPVEELDHHEDALNAPYVRAARALLQHRSTVHTSSSLCPAG